MEQYSDRKTERQATRHMLAGLLAQRRLGFFDRLAARAAWRLSRWNAYWATLSRRGRRAVGRRLAPALLGVSLLGALVITAAPVHAATITVTTGLDVVADDGLCSLVEAIVAANTDAQVYYSAGECPAGSGSDVVTLTSDVTLTEPAFFYYSRLDIYTPMTIEGNGFTIERAAGAPDFRILRNSALGAGLTLNDMTISGGDVYDTFCCDGGGLRNEGKLTLNDVTVSGNKAINGGGIQNFFDLTLNDSTVTGNQAHFKGAGIYNYSSGTVTLNNSVVSDNSADLYTYNGYGGGIYNRRGDVYLNQSRISGNYARGDGGGIYQYGYFSFPDRSVLEIVDSVVSENSSYRTAGIATRHVTTAITGSDILDNEGFNGAGGIGALYGSLTLTDTTVAGNTSGSGALYASSLLLSITGSTISGNTGWQSGGLYIGYATTADIINSTVSGNTASGRGGGVVNIGTLTIENSTVTDNSVAYSSPYGDYGDGGGIANQNGGAVTLIRSIVAGNTALANGDEVFNDSYSSITTAADNVFGHSGITNANAFANFTPSGSDVTATSNGNDPTPLAAILDPLADNGGLTFTHALPSGSPAIDIAPAGPATDQRGEPRPGGAAFDAGAYEAGGGGPANPTLYVSPRANGSAGGITAKPQDIMAQDITTGAWSMHFDGSDVGVNRPLAAFTHLPDGSLLLSLGGSQNLPGLNNVTANDVVRFVPTSLGDTTAGTFEWYVDGSDVGLSASAEKIDALDALSDGRLLISTTGNASVPLGGGMQQKASDEDLLAFSPTATGQNTAGSWALHFDGSAVPGLAAEDIIGVHQDGAGGDLYLAVIDNYNIGGVTGAGKDILQLSPNGGGFDVTRFWRATQNDFDPKISGFDVKP